MAASGQFALENFEPHTPDTNRFVRLASGQAFGIRSWIPVVPSTNSDVSETFRENGLRETTGRCGKTREQNQKPQLGNRKHFKALVWPSGPTTQFLSF